MRILVLSGYGERIYSSNDSLIRALRKEGHSVETCGPYYHTFNSHLPTNHTLGDKSFPEYYTWEEIEPHLHGFEPDFILQIEPHFYLTGPKPPIPIFYYCIDIHCGGSFYYQYIKDHQHLFNAVFLGHPHLGYYFADLPIKFLPLPLAFDEERYNQNVGNHQSCVKCDISFVGQSGIRRELLELNAQEDDIGRYVSKFK